MSKALSSLAAGQVTAMSGEGLAGNILIQLHPTKGRNSLKEQVKQSRVSNTIRYRLIVVDIISVALPDIKQTYEMKTNGMVKAGTDTI